MHLITHGLVFPGLAGQGFDLITIRAGRMHQEHRDDYLDYQDTKESI